MPTRVSYVSDDEPVTLAEAKLAARVDGDELDSFIATCIVAARVAAEHITGRCYRQQVLREELRDWPEACQAIAVHDVTECVVKYWNGTGWSDALAGNTYVFAPGGIGSNGTVLAPAAGTNWPTLGARSVGARVRIDLTAGPASPADADAQVKLYICANVAAWLKTPEAMASSSLVVSPMFARLLDMQTLHGF